MMGSRRTSNTMPVYNCVNHCLSSQGQWQAVHISQPCSLMSGQRQGCGSAHGQCQPIAVSVPHCCLLTAAQMSVSRTTEPPLTNSAGGQPISHKAESRHIYNCRKNRQSIESTSTNTAPPTKPKLRSEFAQTDVSYDPNMTTIDKSLQFPDNNKLREVNIKEKEVELKEITHRTGEKEYEVVQRIANTKISKEDFKPLTEYDELIQKGTMDEIDSIKARRANVEEQELNGSTEKPSNQFIREEISKTEFKNEEIKLGCEGEPSEDDENIHERDIVASAEESLSSIIQEENEDSEQCLPTTPNPNRVVMRCKEKFIKNKMDTEDMAKSVTNYQQIKKMTDISMCNVNDPEIEETKVKEDDKEKLNQYGSASLIVNEYSDDTFYTNYANDPDQSDDISAIHIRRHYTKEIETKKAGDTASEENLVSEKTSVEEQHTAKSEPDPEPKPKRIQKKKNKYPSKDIVSQRRDACRSRCFMGSTYCYPCHSWTYFNCSCASNRCKCPCGEMMKCYPCYGFGGQCIYKPYCP